MIKICEFYHPTACSDYFAQFLLLKLAFPMKKVMLKRVIHYVTLNPFDVNDDIIF